MNKWISVEEKFPDDEVPILCFLHYSEGNEKEKIVIKKIIVGTPEKNSYWIKGDNWQYYKICCTHWMPLPTPPQENTANE